MQRTEAYAELDRLAKAGQLTEAVMIDFITSSDEQGSIGVGWLSVAHRLPSEVFGFPSYKEVRNYENEKVKDQLDWASVVRECIRSPHITAFYQWVEELVPQQDRKAILALIFSYHGPGDTVQDPVTWHRLKNTLVTYLSLEEISDLILKRAEGRKEYANFLLTGGCSSEMLSETQRFRLLKVCADFDPHKYLPFRGRYRPLPSDEMRLLTVFAADAVGDFDIGWGQFKDLPPNLQKVFIEVSQSPPYSDRIAALVHGPTATYSLWRDEWWKAGIAALNALDDMDRKRPMNRAKVLEALSRDL